jgi:UDP-N-acetylglucosamine 2-epimerase (non-hydrolysing)
MSSRILVTVGTRPEAIKMAPVIMRLRREPDAFETIVCATAQHRELLDGALGLFSIRPDLDLDLMCPNQTINDIASRVFDSFDRVLVETMPDWVLVQGDTTTVMAASLAAFHRGMRVGHVEAGLRTGDLQQPFPEELNRRVTDLFAEALFAPTPRSAAALAAEGVDGTRVHLTGNTVVDALQHIAASLPPRREDRLVLITCHRRESFGEPMRRVFRALARLARRFPDFAFVLPLHPNPNVQAAAAVLRGIGNLSVVAPVDYRQLLTWIRDSRLVLTDSGGIQEEAPTFGKPTLVLRETTERPEGIEAGVARLVGTDEDRIVEEATRLLADEEAWRDMVRATNPYGDGCAAERIVDFLAGRPFRPFVPA